MKKSNMKTTELGIQTAKTADLVAFYNENIMELPANIRGSKKPVSKFADRKTAEKRVTWLVAELADLDVAPAPAPNKKAPTKSGSRSEGIRRSWKRPEVKAKRSERHGVRVDSVEYSSTRQAFIALGMDLKYHIAFRMLLKEKGTLKDEGRTWVVFEK